jgi:hypothetical protein
MNWRSTSAKPDTLSSMVVNNSNRNAVRTAVLARSRRRQPIIIRPAAWTEPTPPPTRKSYEATLRWTPLLNGFGLSEVVNETGAVVDSGVGNNARRAFLKLHERLIPPE